MAPQGSPSHLVHLLDRLRDSRTLTSNTSLRVLKETLHFLLGFYADLARDLSQVFGELKFEPAGPDPGVAERSLSQALGFLTTDAPEDIPEVKALVQVFFEEDRARKITGLMGISGKPRRGFKQLSKFLESESTVTVKKADQELRRYLGFLEEWLQDSASFFGQMTILSERAIVGEPALVRVRLGKQELTAGPSLDLRNCPLCVAARELPLPGTEPPAHSFIFVPQLCPPPLEEMFRQFDRAVAEDDPAALCLEARNALEFLMRFFATVTSTVCAELDLLDEPDQALLTESRSLPSSEILLVRCLEALRECSDTLVSKPLVDVFYRAGQPREHTQLLRKEELAEWCYLEPGYGHLEFPEACRAEFHRQLPILQNWLKSCAPYFSSSEHFFTDPEEDESVSFSVRIGNRLFETGPNPYRLWLNNPRPQAAAAVATPDTEQLQSLIPKPLFVPEGCPGFLARVLARAEFYLRAGDPVESYLSLQAALDYLTRYFAGLTGAALKQRNCLPEEARELLERCRYVEACEKLLLLFLLAPAPESEADEALDVSLRRVFFRLNPETGEEKALAHTRVLLRDASPTTRRLQLATFCENATPPNPGQAKREVRKYLPALQDWLDAAAPWFKDSLAISGKDESLGVLFQGKKLVLPEYEFFPPKGADRVPEGEMPEIVWPEEPQEDSLEESEPIVEDPPLLVYRVQHIARRPNKAGKECEAGYIIVSNAGGGNLTGLVTTTHPSLEVEPTRFRGSRTQISYWLDEEEVPETHEAFVRLKTAREERFVTVRQMREKSTRKAVGARGALLRLLAALLLPLVVFGVLGYLGQAALSHTLAEQLGPDFVEVNLFERAPAARAQVLWIAQGLGFLYLCLAGMLPVAIGTVYRRFPPAARARSERVFRRILMLPIPLAFLMVGPLWWVDLAWDPDFPTLQLLRLFPWWAGISLLAVAYVEMSVTEKLDEWFHNLIVRKYVIPASAWVTLFILIGVATQS